MDCLDLLAREDEFKKLNKQLEKKTEKLMKQIELQMQKQDIFSEFSSLTLSPVQTNTRKHSCLSSSNTTPEKTPVKVNNVSRKSSKEPMKIDVEATQDLEENNLFECKEVRRVTCDCFNNNILSRKDRINEDLEFLYAFVNVNVQDKVFPPSFVKEKPSVERVCKFLANKVKLMQEQVEKLQTALDKKVSQCEVHLTHQAELESCKMTLMNSCNNLKASSADARAKCQLLQKKLDEKDAMYKEQRSEADKLSVEVKRLKSRNASLEAKNASNENTIQTLRHQVECAKRAEKELRESSRSMVTQHEASVTRVKDELKQSRNRIRKQSSLIANLRKQRALIIALNGVDSVQKQLNMFLEQDL